jgi:hypothetical protein
MSCYNGAVRCENDTADYLRVETDESTIFVYKRELDLDTDRHVYEEVVSSLDRKMARELARHLTAAADALDSQDEAQMWAEEHADEDDGEAEFTITPVDKHNTWLTMDLEVDSETAVKIAELVVHRRRNNDAQPASV